MSLLLVVDVFKHYGAQEVLRGASLQVDPGEKVGLVGRNGGGKTTLLRLVEGLEAADRGTVTLRKGARLGHVPQSPTFAAGETARAYVAEGMEEARAAWRESETLAEGLAQASGPDLERRLEAHERSVERARRLGAWEIDRRVETVMSGIGLATDLWDREARTLSGGERGRVALARELVAGHDLLLLDEPTNHLDLAGIEWLEDWLATIPSAVLVVSHDRRLLDTAVDAIVELERGETRRYPGRYSKYVSLREARYRSELRAWEVQQEHVRKEEEFIRRHMGGQRTGEARGRQRRLESLVRLERPHHDVRRPSLPAPIASRGGDLVLEARGLAGGYGRRRVFDGLDLRIGRGQRIGVVGSNGAGKSNLLRVLAGRAEPLAGSLQPGHRALCGYYDQDTSALDDAATPYVEVSRRHVRLPDLEIRSHLARFLFRGAEVEKPVASLSGGERARLSLALLFLTEVTWLAMDEPTNHLDLAARTALEEMLGGFEGALVCVSHDRAFLDDLCSELLVVEGGRVRAFAGSYSAWRAARAEEAARRAGERGPSAAPPKREAPGPRPDASKRVRNPWAFERLEARIVELEAERARLHAALAEEEVYRDPSRLREAQVRLAEVERDLDDANERWEHWA